MTRDELSSALSMHEHTINDRLQKCATRSGVGTHPCRCLTPVVSRIETKLSGGDGRTARSADRRKRKA